MKVMDMPMYKFIMNNKDVFENYTSKNKFIMVRKTTKDGLEDSEVYVEKSLMDIFRLYKNHDLKSLKIEIVNPMKIGTPSYLDRFINHSNDLRLSLHDALEIAKIVFINMEEDFNFGSKLTPACGNIEFISNYASYVEEDGYSYYGCILSTLRFINKENISINSYFSTISQFFN